MKSDSGIFYKLLVKGLTALNKTPECKQTGDKIITKENKLGYISVQKLWENLWEVKDIPKKLEQYMAIRSTRIKELMQEIQRSIDNNSPRADIMPLLEEVQEENKAVLADVKAKAEQINMNIIKKINLVIISVAKNNGYSHIFTDNNILYASDGNIRIIVQRKLNDEYCYLVNLPL